MSAARKPVAAMLDRAGIAALIPHGGAMCLLDRVASWSDGHVVAHALSHLDGLNPLRRAGRLGAASGVEYGLQAAALHGALRGGLVAQRAGYVASLRGVELAVRFLDDAAFGTLEIEARLVQADDAGMIYDFRVASEAGAALVSGRGVVVLPRPAPVMASAPLAAAR